MSDPTVYASIELLQNRIAALEAMPRCACSTCVQAALAVKERATRERYGEILSTLDAQVRNAKIADLTPAERIVLWSHVTDPAIVLELDDATREEAMQRVTVGVRHRVQLATLERDGRLPRTCRVRLASQNSTWTRSEMPVDKATAKAVRAVMPDRVGPHPLHPSTVIFYPLAFPSVGDEHRIPVEAVEVVKAADPKFAAACEEGRISILPATLDDDRARQLNEWNQRQ